jgi:hypothetical protein
MGPRSGRERLVKIVGGFLAVSYGVGAPAIAILEYRGQWLSQRFHIPPELVYLTCAVQLLSAVGVLVSSVASWAAAALTVTTLGAMALHARIGSPMTGIPAAVFTAVQIWFGLERRRWHVQLRR